MLGNVFCQNFGSLYRRMSGYWQPCDVSEPYARGDQDLARDVNTAGARAGDR